MHHNPTGYGKKNVLFPTGIGQESNSDFRYWSFGTIHKVFMLSLSKDGGSVRLCERTRFTGYEISITLDAAMWLLEKVESMIEAKEYRRTDRRTFRNNSMRLLLECFQNARGVFLKISVLKHSVFESIIVLEEGCTKGWKVCILLGAFG